jgi:hypothetical protein
MQSFYYFINYTVIVLRLNVKLCKYKNNHRMILNGLRILIKKKLIIYSTFVSNYLLLFPRQYW